MSKLSGSRVEKLLTEFRKRRVLVKISRQHHGVLEAGGDQHRVQSDCQRLLGDPAATQPLDLSRARSSGNGVWWFLLLQHFPQRRLHGVGPDLVALFIRMKQIRHDAFW